MEPILTLNDQICQTYNLSQLWLWMVCYSSTQKCPARGKNCKICGIAKPKPIVNNVDDNISEAATVATSATGGEQVNQIDKLLQKHSTYDANYDSEYAEFDDNCVAIISNNDNIREVETLNANICIGNTNTKALVDSGTVCTIINKNLANAVVSDFQESF